MIIPIPTATAPATIGHIHIPTLLAALGATLPATCVWPPVPVAVHCAPHE